MYDIQASRKKQLIKEGKLDKFGRSNESTPKDWSKSYKDLRYCVYFTDTNYLCVALFYETAASNAWWAGTAQMTTWCACDHGGLIIGEHRFLVFVFKIIFNVNVNFV